MAFNPFASEVAGRMYATARPDYSPLAAEVIQKLTGIDAPVPRALDVACGTGLSTRAVAPLARAVVGVDRSRAMLEHAPALDNTVYVLASAEALPLTDGTFDLVAVGSALHWLDRTRFLAEVSRVATPAAWLVVHTHWFEGEMLGRPEFGDWSRNTYTVEFPTPPRDRSWRPPEDLGDWRHVAWERYDHGVEMTAAELVSYLMTQSNVQVVLERGDLTEAQVRDRLGEQVGPLFGRDATAAFMFAGYVACHRRSATGTAGGAPH